MSESEAAAGKRASGLEMDVQYLKGVGPKMAMVLKKLGLTTVQDVLWRFPRRMEDRRQLPPILLASPGQACTVRGRLRGIVAQPTRGGKVMLKATLVDDSGSIDLVWFNQPWVKRDLEKGSGDVIAYGVVKEGRAGKEMSSPEWEFIDPDEEGDDFTRLVPVYPLKEGVPQRMMRRAAQSAVEYFANQAPDPLPGWIRERFNLKDLGWSLRQMHLPQNENDQIRARERLAFEEFLYLQLELQIRRRQVAQEVGISFPISRLGGSLTTPTSLFGGEEVQGGIWDQVRAILPFELTGAQTRVVNEIWADMERGAPMNRLVQGDVGSGKTAVAACAILACIRCGYQAALMAPTEILAEQHAVNLRRIFEPLGIPVVLLVGKLNAAQKRKALAQAANGEAQLCIGTHALVQEGVAFHRLGLAVIDEQHRFGVLQRAALRQKGMGHPDVLVMTATPIPRTMTMAVYGDLDVSVIDELPPGRKAIKTYWKQARQRDSVYESVRQLLEQGRQAYFVCPMISESEKMQTQAAEELHARLKVLVFPDYRVGLLHGQMKGADKEEIMGQFRRHELDILVSTVVIEVGVDVPNATVMVIEDAYRFGLAQLHQLRGRVGRGQHQSYCILVSTASTPESEQRLKVMVETSDGFRIAEEDLKIRGPGDVAGTKQSGKLNFRVADLMRDILQLERAKEAAILILERDPGLTSEENQPLLAGVRAQRSDDALIAAS